MINLAHGDFIVLGAYVAAVTMGSLGMGALTSLSVVLPLMFGLGWLLQMGLLNRVMGTNPLSPLLVTFGMSVVIQNLLQTYFTANTRSLPSDGMALQGLHFGEVSIGVLPLIIAGVIAGFVVMMVLETALV